jgi:hypothetical protein
VDELGELAADNSPDSTEAFDTPEVRRKDMMPLAEGRVSTIDEELERTDTFELRLDSGREPVDGRLSEVGEVLALRRSVIFGAVEEEFMSDRGTASLASTSLSSKMCLTPSSRALSTLSALTKVTNPKPLLLRLMASFMTTTSATGPNALKYSPRAPEW